MLTKKEIACTRWLTLAVCMPVFTEEAIIAWIFFFFVSQCYFKSDELGARAICSERDDFVTRRDAFVFSILSSGHLEYKLPPVETCRRILNTPHQ